MDNNFQLSKYDMGDYIVYRLESTEEQIKNPQQMGFAIIELKEQDVPCAHCSKETNVMQTWWHNQLPFSYVSGEEKELDINLCLECATEQNNSNILLLKNDAQLEDKQNLHKLLQQYEIENEQIEYFKLYKKEQKQLVSNIA